MSPQSGLKTLGFNALEGGGKEGRKEGCENLFFKAKLIKQLSVQLKTCKAE